MPTYNVGKYVGEAIESILHQSFTDWELIIVDDCSKDNTIDVVNKFITKYPQIRLIKRKQNSGGCRLPRFDGIMTAKGKYVCPVDSDDLLEVDYLQKMYQRQRDTNSTLILGRIIKCDEDGKPQNWLVPNNDFDFSIIESGKDACKKTIGGWKIALNGLLATTLYYQEYIKSVYNNSCNFGFADEIDHRRILLGAKKVAYVNALYYYRQSPNSIIHTPTIRFFDRLKTINLLKDFVKENFSNDIDVISNLEYEYIGTVSASQRTFLKNKKSYSTSEQQEINELIKICFEHIKKYKMKGRTIKQRIATSNYLLFILLSKLESFTKK